MNSIVIYALVAVMLIFEMLLIACVINPPVNIDTTDYIVAADAYQRNSTTETETAFKIEKQKTLGMRKKIKKTNRINLGLLTTLNSAAIIFLIIFTFRKHANTKQSEPSE